MCKLIYTFLLIIKRSLDELNVILNDFGGGTWVELRLYAKSNREDGGENFIFCKWRPFGVTTAAPYRARAQDSYLERI